MPTNRRPRPNRSQQTGDIRPVSARQVRVRPTTMSHGPRLPVKPKKPIPGLTAPPAPTPAAPTPALAAPTTSGFVPDAAYNNAITQAQRVEAERLGQLDTQERQTKFEYGIDDPTNPNSRMAALKQMYLARSGGSLNAAASAGQLYSGSTEQGLQLERRGDEQRNAALRAAYDRALTGIGNARASAKTATEEARNAAYADWLSRQGTPDITAPEEDQIATAAPAATSPPAFQVPRKPQPVKHVMRPKVRKKK